MKLHSIGYCLICGASLLACAATTLGQDQPGQKPAPPPRGRYEDPQEIKPRDANPRIKSVDDLWKRKHLVWDYKPTNPQTEKICAALDQQTRMEFLEAPLQDVISFLKDQHDIEIELDLRALADAAIDAETPVTKNLKNISLRSALRLMLNDFELAYVIKNEVLLITSAARAKSMMETRVYETRLLKCAPPETLARIITASISPRLWRENGGAGRITALPTGLVVYQNQGVHAEIKDLLRQLDAHEGNPLFPSQR